VQKGNYFDYGLARISREYLIGDLAKSNLSSGIVDKALDFGPSGSNPDLSADMTEDQIMSIVQAYIAAGVDIAKVDTAIWEKVGAYAAATSIYWNKRKALGL
jgi:methionine synthase I (cobalamin-dependent)